MDPIRYLADDGTLLADPPVGTDRARDLFAAMVVARTYDRKASALQRQGRLATYAQFEGRRPPRSAVQRLCGPTTGWWAPTATPPPCGTRGTGGSSCSSGGWVTSGAVRLPKG
jgi:hypothetical protein